MVTPPPLNVLVEIPEEQELMVKECCQTTLAVRNQRAICSKGKIIKPYHRQARMQLSSICKVVEHFQESCEQRQRADDSNEVLEATSPQVSRERMGSQRVTDLLRYHSLVEDFSRLAECWMAAGQLRGPANAGGGYLLDLTIPLSGEEGDVLLGEIARGDEGDMDTL